MPPDPPSCSVLTRPLQTWPLQTWWLRPCMWAFLEYLTQHVVALIQESWLEAFSNHSYGFLLSIYTHGTTSLVHMLLPSFSMLAVLQHESMSIYWTEKDRFAIISFKLECIHRILTPHAAVLVSFPDPSMGKVWGRDTAAIDLIPTPIIRPWEVEPERNSHHMRHLDSLRRCPTLLSLPSSYPLLPSIFPSGIDHLPSHLSCPQYCFQHAHLYIPEALQYSYRESLYCTLSAWQ